MPCVVKECGRRGADGAGRGVCLMAASVTQSSFSSWARWSWVNASACKTSPREERGEGGEPPLYRFKCADCQIGAGCGVRLVWLGFSAPRGKVDALQFAFLYFPVPAGRLARLFRARPRQQSDPGGLADAGLAGLLCVRRVALR